MIELYHNNVWLAGLWENRPRVADWFARIKARPSYKAIADYPPTDYDDTGRDGLKYWQRIKQLIATKPSKPLTTSGTFVLLFFPGTLNSEPPRPPSDIRQTLCNPFSRAQLP